jgi:hypothetical protein
MKRRGIFLITLLAGLVLALSAGATTILRVNFDELVRLSHAVARGKCISTETRMDNENIWTFTTFEVEETLKGSAAGQITIRMPGGKLGHMTSTVDAVPQYRAGEELVLFLLPTGQGDYSVLGWVQGTFRVRRDADTGKETVTQDTASIAVFDPATRQFKPSGVRNMPLDVFRQQVRDAMNRQRTSK